MTIGGEADPKAEHAELVGRVRRFVAEEVAPRAAGIDRENAFSADVYRRMGYAEVVDDAVRPTRYQVDGAWRPLEKRIESYRDQKGTIIRTDTLYFTHRGAMSRQMGKWMSMRWTAQEPSDELSNFLKLGITTSGYVPLGGVAISDEIHATFAHRTYPGGLPYSGHPLACAAAVATIETMKDERIVENAATLGETVFGPGLAELAERHPCVGEVRGVGAFWALDLVADRETREPLAPYGGTSPAMNEIVAACKKHGLLPFVNYHRLHVVPALNITADEARAGLAVLDEALSVGDAHAAR